MENIKRWAVSLVYQMPDGEIRLAQMITKAESHEEALGKVLLTTAKANQGGVIAAFKAQEIDP